MTKILKYQAGYTITINSWENDGDYKNEQTIHTASKSMASLMVKLLDVLSKSDNTNRYGVNMDAIMLEVEPLERLYLAEYPNTDDPAEYFENFIYDFTYDAGLGSEYYNCRVVDDFSVMYFPEDLYVEIVTEELLV